MSFDPFPSFSILFCVKGEKGGKRKQKENALFLMHCSPVLFHSVGATLIYSFTLGLM